MNATEEPPWEGPDLLRRAKDWYDGSQHDFMNQRADEWAADRAQLTSKDEEIARYRDVLHRLNDHVRFFDGKPLDAQCVSLLQEALTQPTGGE